MFQKGKAIMKKTFICIIGIQFILFSGLIKIFAQNEERRFQAYLGPRIGVTYVASDPEEFNEQLQKMYPNDDRKYIPFFTQFGINLEQRVRLGSTKSHFAIQEILVVGGIDQGIFIPSFSFLIGFRSHTGFEFGLGPNFILKWAQDELELATSVLYAIGWTFSFHTAYIPINLAVIPTPADGHPRFSLVSGFNFKL